METTPATEQKGWRPVAVGIVRGVAEAAVLAAVGALAEAVGALDLPDALIPFASGSVAVLRSAEGWLDQRIDPTRQRAGGGAPAQ